MMSPEVPVEILSDYEKSHRETLDAISPGLWRDLARVPALPPVAAERVLEHLLVRACRATHCELIENGRKGIAAIPHDWVVTRIERVAERSLDLQDDLEYRQLLELYSDLDRALLARLVDRGLQSTNPHVVEAAHDFEPDVRTPNPMVRAQRVTPLETSPGVERLEGALTA